MHIAAAVLMTADDPDEVIAPAVNGTKRILQSALKPEHRARIKRVLYMSSTAAIWLPPPPGKAVLPRPLDENDWNTYSVELVKEKGRAAPGPEKYRAAKTLAERAAWDMYEQAKAEGGLAWDLVVLNSPFIFGPVVHEATTLESFGGTPRHWLDNVILKQAQGDALTKLG